MAVVITKPSSGVEVKGTITVEATYNGQRFNVATCTVDGKQLGSDSMQPISFSVDMTKVQDGDRSLTVAVKYRTPAGKMRWQKASIPIKVANALPNQWAKVADEYETFTLTATAEVRYGTGTAWNSKVLGPGSYQCGNPLFGDPLPGANKQCEKRSTTGTPPPPPPPPPPPNGLPPETGPVTIKTPGVHTINARSTTTAPCVTVDVPGVALRGRISKPANVAGDHIRGHGGGYSIDNLMLERLTVDGGLGRLLDFEHFNSIRVRDVTVNRTSGMKLSECNPGAVIEVLRVKGRNIQGPDTGGAALSQICQLAQNHGASKIELGWIEVINDPEVSHCEDVLSIFGSDGVYAHDLYFEGQWTVGNKEESSQNGVTLEHDARDCRIEDFQLVAGMGVGIFSGSGNSVLRGRVVRSGLYPDGVTRAKIGYSGIGVSPGQFSNNHLHGNLVGYVSGTKHGFGRTDWADDSMPADCLPQNTHYPGTVTRASEQAEWDRWVAKRSANGVTVGAS